MGAGGLVTAISGANSRTAGQGAIGLSPSSSRLVSVSSEHWKNPRPHVCPRCGYIARDKTNLRKHMYTHTGEKPYECRWCSYKTTQSSNLHTHTRRHHPLQASSLVSTPTVHSAPSNFHANLFSSVRNLQHNFEMQALFERGFGNDSHPRNASSSTSGGRGHVVHPSSLGPSTPLRLPNKGYHGLASDGDKQQDSHAVATASVNCEASEHVAPRGNTTPVEHNPTSDIRAGDGSANVPQTLAEPYMYRSSDSEDHESTS